MFKEIVDDLLTKGLDFSKYLETIYWANGQDIEPSFHLLITKRQKTILGEVFSEELQINNNLYFYYQEGLYQGIPNEWDERGEYTMNIQVREFNDMPKLEQKMQTVLEIVNYQPE